MESKLLVGGRSIIDHTHEQQKKIEQQQEEMAQQKVNYHMTNLTCHVIRLCGHMTL